MAFCALATVAFPVRRSHAQVNPPQSSRLFADTAAPVVDHPADNATVARRRPIQLDPAGLEELRAGHDLTLNLFANTTLIVHVDRAWQDSIDTFHWQGHVPGEQPRSVIMTLHRGVLWATIDSGGVPL